MKTEVTMRRELFGEEVLQKSKSEWFSASHLAKAGNKWRATEGMPEFNLSQFLKNKSTAEFIEELTNKYGKCIEVSRGAKGNTWVHPLLFIDIALAISPKLKVEVYEWLFDNLIKYRNDSGDSYRRMASHLFQRYDNKRDYPRFITKVAEFIKKECGVEDWQSANEKQLELRDKIHNSIATLTNVLRDPSEAVRIGTREHTGFIS